MNHFLESAYIGINSPDPAKVSAYLQDVVGLQPGEATAAGARTFRVDGKAQRVVVHQGEVADAAYIGFEAIDKTAFEKTVARLNAQGFNAQPGTAAELAERRVAGLVRVMAPWGTPVELVHGLADAGAPFESAAFPNGIVTQGQGFGHFVFKVSPDVYDASVRFAIDGLGLNLSDTLRMPMGPFDMHVTFLHCNPRHHSLALACVPIPPDAQKLHHINFEVTAVRDVGHAFERALMSNTPVANMIGQHANDRMISFYSVSPDGWQVEVGATGKVVGDDWKDVREYDRISDWGHQPPQVMAGMQGLLPEPA